MPINDPSYSERRDRAREAREKDLDTERDRRTAELAAEKAAANAARRAAEKAAFEARRADKQARAARRAEHQVPDTTVYTSDADAAAQQVVHSPGNDGHLPPQVRAATRHAREAMNRAAGKTL